MKTFGRKMLAVYASFFLLSMLVLSLCACSTGTNSEGGGMTELRTFQ